MLVIRLNRIFALSLLIASAKGTVQQQNQTAASGKSLFIIFWIYCTRFLKCTYQHTMFLYHHMPIIAGCKCNTFISAKGIGMCKKKDKNFEGAYSCYVDQPSSCPDLKESKTIPEYQLSAKACQGNDIL